MTIPYEKILGVEEQDGCDLDWEDWGWEEEEDWLPWEDDQQEYGIIDGGQKVPTINNA